MPESNEENLNDETLAGPEREEEAQETSRDGQPVVADDPALEPGSPEDDEKLLGFPVVAMGASAGGLEAYFDIFDTLRPDTGMAFVVLSHLAPDRRSYLAEILSRRTSMPVVEIGNREQPVPNHVYVVAPGSHVTIHGGTFVVDSSQRPRYPRVIDNFFFSLASDQKSRVSAFCSRASTPMEPWG